MVESLIVGILLKFLPDDVAKRLLARIPWKALNRAIVEARRRRMMEEGPFEQVRKKYRPKFEALIKEMADDMAAYAKSHADEMTEQARSLRKADLPAADSKTREMVLEFDWSFVPSKGPGFQILNADNHHIAVPLLYVRFMPDADDLDR